MTPILWAIGTLRVKNKFGYHVAKHLCCFAGKGFYLFLVIDEVCVSHTHEEDVGWQTRQQSDCNLRLQVCNFIYNSILSLEHKHNTIIRIGQLFNRQYLNTHYWVYIILILSFKSKYSFFYFALNLFVYGLVIVLNYLWIKWNRKILS